VTDMTMPRIKESNKCALYITKPIPL